MADGVEKKKENPTLSLLLTLSRKRAHAKTKPKQNNIKKS